jgi:hypothetical protein
LALCCATLTNADLTRAKLSGADLTYAKLSGAYLEHADLTGAYLEHADLTGAYLGTADLTGAKLVNANLAKANLTETNLSGENLTDVKLSSTVFANVDLSSVIGLDTCIHEGPSFIDHRTLRKSGPLPLAFLRGVGLPDLLIDYLPSLLNQAIQHYSCFISYSTQDQEFAHRLHGKTRQRVS